MRHVIVLVSLSLAACPEGDDPCAGVRCPPDRTCIALESGAQCVCADPAVEVGGECVEDGGEGE